MSEAFTFTGTTSALPNLIFEEDADGQCGNNILIESVDESYVTAYENTETRYLSFLDDSTTENTDISEVKSSDEAYNSSSDDKLEELVVLTVVSPKDAKPSLSKKDSSFELSGGSRTESTEESGNEYRHENQIEIIKLPDDEDEMYEEYLREDSSDDDIENEIFINRNSTVRQYTKKSSEKQGTVLPKLNVSTKDGGSHVINSSVVLSSNNQSDVIIPNIRLRTSYKNDDIVLEKLSLVRNRENGGCIIVSESKTIYQSPKLKTSVQTLKKDRQETSEHLDTTLAASQNAGGNILKILKPKRNLIEAKDEKFIARKKSIPPIVLNNFDKVTVPQVPIRKDRLPRKQKINPVERMDEEIVVQEVMVSSQGFIRPKVDKTDSSDDEMSRRKRARIKDSNGDVGDQGKQSKINEIEIIDEETIELDSDDNESTKRRKMKCPNCTETFSTKMSYKSHLHDHELEDNLKESLGAKNDVKMPSKYNYKCDNCGNCFVNAILLERHRCPKSTKAYECVDCKKNFTNETQFKVHRRFHLIKSTTKTAVKISDKKNIDKESEKEEMPKNKRPVGRPRKQVTPKAPIFKCLKCSETFKSQALLDAHKKSHLKTLTRKMYSCTDCKQKFTDPKLLNAHRKSHARRNSEKKTVLTRASLKVANNESKLRPRKTDQIANRLKCVKCGKVCSSKDILNTHLRTHNTTKVIRRRSSGFKSNSDRISMLRCNKCTMRFQSLRLLSNHKFVKHGMKMSIKSATPSSVRKNSAHDGIPANSKLRKAWDGFKNKS